MQQVSREITTGKVFVDALGPMVHDKKRVEQVLLFIRSMRNAENENLPQMSFDELKDCMPLSEAFSKLEEEVRQSYNL